MTTRSATGRPLRPVQALQVRRAMDAAVLATGPSVGTLSVWTALANLTLGYSRLEDRLTQRRLGKDAGGVTRHTVRRALGHLAGAGLISYRPGYGDSENGENVFSVIRVLVPEEVLAAADSDSTGSDAGAGSAGSAQSGSEEASEEQQPPVRGSSDPRTPQEAAPAAHEQGPTLLSSSVTGGGQSGRGQSEEVQQGGRSRPSASAQADPPRDTSPAPSTDLVPSAASEAGVVAATYEAYAEVCREAGRPVARRSEVQAGIARALDSGYEPEQVWFGLGFWLGEGFMTPSQIEEFCERAARVTNVRGRGLTATDAVNGGIAAWAQRDRVLKTTAKEAREQDTLAALRRSVEQRTREEAAS